MKKKKDPLTFERHGMSIILIRPNTKRALRWLETRLETESWQWLGGGVAVDVRHADGIAAMAQEEL